MDTSNTILFQWKKEQAVFSTNLSMLQQKLEKESIHDLRVAIKKLRAYLSCYDWLVGEAEFVDTQQQLYFHKTENLFAIIGRQRDVEICMEKLAELKKETNFVCNGFTGFLKTTLKQSMAWTNEAVHQYRKKELAQIALLLKQDDSLKDESTVQLKINAALQKQLEELSSQFKKPHLLRQALKTIYYWLTILADYEKYQPASLHSILDDLGNWQDFEVLAVRLRHFRKDYLPKPLAEYTVLKEMEKSIEEKKKNLLTAAIRKCKHWIKVVTGK